MSGIEAHYISSNSFWIYTDRTSEFVYGRRLKANCGSDGYKYTTISGSYFSDPKTYVTTLDSILTSNLEEVWYGSSSGSLGSLPVHTHLSLDQGGVFYIPGFQTISYEYATSSGIRINSGCICIDTGTEKKTLFNNSSFVKNVDVSSDGIQYIYVDGNYNSISSSSVLLSTSSPDKNLSRYGFFHPTNSSMRCIGAILVSSGSVKKFYISSNRLYFFGDFNDTSPDPMTPSNTWTDTKVTVPLFDDFNVLMATFRISYINADGNWASVRCKGESEGTRIQICNSNNQDNNVSLDVIANSTGYIQLKFYNSCNNEIRLFNRGWVFPSLVVPS